MADVVRLREMSTSPSSYVTECMREAASAALVARHYPDAEREKIREGFYVWSHPDALAKATAFDIFDGRFYAYQEIREGDANVRVYVRWDAVVRDWDFVERLRLRHELHDGILAMLKGSK